MDPEQDSGTGAELRARPAQGWELCPERREEDGAPAEPQDEAAALAGALYIDLNPIRAGKAETPEQWEFTSAYDRIQGRRQRAARAAKAGMEVPATGALLLDVRYADDSDDAPTNTINAASDTMEVMTTDARPAASAHRGASPSSYGRKGAAPRASPIGGSLPADNHRKAARSPTSP